MIQIKNHLKVGTDRGQHAISIRVPIVLTIADEHSLWYPETMDAAAAERMRESIGWSGVEAHVVDVEIILPPAVDFVAAAEHIHQVRAKPARIQFSTP